MKKISVIVVAHLIDTGIPYIKTLEKYFNVIAIIPKQKSIDQNLLKYFSEEKLLYVSRKEISNSEKIIELLEQIPIENKIIFLDIGGYFLQIGNAIKDKFGNRFLGIIEDTENDHQKYLKKELKYPVISVARSKLKENEDYLVGQAVVFSSEALLREHGLLFNSKNIGIIGIGKIGNSQLGPVYEILGEDFTYQELKLTRLFIEKQTLKINNNRG